MFENQNKIARVINLLKERNMSQIIIYNPYDIFYLTGEFIEAGERFCCLYINIDGTKKLFVNKIFEPKDDFDGFNNEIERIVYLDEDDPIKIFLEQIKNYTGEKIFVDKNLPARFFLRMINFGVFDIKKFFLSDILEHARLIKTQAEINFMREISNQTDKIMSLLIKNIKSNQTEIDLQEDLIQIKKNLGLKKFSFDPIIAFGKNAAEPHHVPNNTKLKPGDCIVIDIGFIKNNYCSDMTRTFFYKYIDELNKKIYNIVLQANLLAIKKIKPEIKFCEIDLVARDFIKLNGYGENFTHTTGHSIGLECHEFGTVSFKNHEFIKENMIFSIEPGIYIKNKLGIRIEDLVLVNKNGCELLNGFEKEIIVIE